MNSYGFLRIPKIPNNLYKEHLKELGNNDEKRGFMDDFNKYIKLIEWLRQ